MNERMILAWSFANLFNPLKEPCCNDIHLETLNSSWITKVHSTNHPPTHSPIHTSMHQLIHLPIHHVSTRLLSHPSTDPPIYSSICLSIHPSSHQIFLEGYHWLRSILDTGDTTSEPNKVLLSGSLCSRWRSHIVNRLKHHHDNVRRWPML